MLNAGEKKSVADVVYVRLRDRILTEDLKPGDALPGERKLSEQFGVNRGAVREGLRRLAHARLVTVQHGGATRVLDYRRAGLDLLAELIEVRGISSFVTDVLELRDTLAPLIARRAAERNGDAAAEALRPVLARIEAAVDAQSRYPEIRIFWRILGEQAGNLALRLALNSLQQGALVRMDLSERVLGAEIAAVGAYREITDAVAAGDGPKAASAASKLVAPTLALARQLSGEDTAS
ncbi:MAG: GntR family transcriptional repressor for pyruvate dehydrogenase complex [Bradymonadia bacterium]|jgi:GntR family transcriptional repressor for pyruvate dehydrogenase complex